MSLGKFSLSNELAPPHHLLFISYKLKSLIISLRVQFITVFMSTTICFKITVVVVVHLYILLAMSTTICFKIHVVVVDFSGLQQHSCLFTLLQH